MHSPPSLPPSLPPLNPPPLPPLTFLPPSPPSLPPSPSPLPAAERELFIRATNLVENKLEIFVEGKLKKDRYLGNADWNVVYR